MILKILLVYTCFMIRWKILLLLYDKNVYNYNSAAVIGTEIIFSYLF